jgi:hypothetical protein
MRDVGKVPGLSRVIDAGFTSPPTGVRPDRPCMRLLKHPLRSNRREKAGACIRPKPVAPSLTLLSYLFRLAGERSTYGRAITKEFPHSNRSTSTSFNRIFSTVTVVTGGFPDTLMVDAVLLSGPLWAELTLWNACSHCFIF